jgi:hypothetical protein
MSTSSSKYGNTCPRPSRLKNSGSSFFIFSFQALLFASKFSMSRPTGDVASFTWGVSEDVLFGAANGIFKLKHRTPTQPIFCRLGRMSWFACMLVTNAAQRIVRESSFFPITKKTNKNMMLHSGMAPAMAFDQGFDSDYSSNEHMMGVR